MRKLPNTYTTIEQSNHIIELGVPASSADCTAYKTDNGEWEYELGLDGSIRDNLFSYRNGYTIPIWSVGQLIKIIGKCRAGLKFTTFITSEDSDFLGHVIGRLETLAANNEMDYSKL